MAEKILEHNSYDEYISNMAAYSVVVIRRRAVSEIRDGLKNIQRRIIYDIFHDQGKGLTKSKKITGDVIGVYSPHGDDAAYQAFRPILNWFQCKLPLLTGHGNFGALDGSPASASRYTEAKLSDFCKDAMVADMLVDPSVVNFSPNFDGTTKEPDYLPCKVPLLLINGSSGIAVGISSSIPTHNPNEVINAAIELLHNPDANILLIPDQCQPTNIIDTDWEQINQVGGSFKVRGLTEFGEYQGYPAIFIKSLPDGVTSDKIKDTLNDLAEKKEISSMIKQCIDSTKNTVNIIIKLEKGIDPYFVRDLLYKKTALESTISVNFEAIDGIESVNLSYKEYLLRWLKYRKTTKARVYNLRLKKATTEMHTMETYIKALESGYIDEIVALIRRQKKVDDRSVITNFIIEKCKMTPLQAEFILRTDLRHLAQGYLPIYKDRYAQLKKEYDLCEDFIIHPEKIVEEIEREMIEIRDKYGMPRLAKVIKASDDTNIPKGTFKVVITENNYVRKLLLEDKANSVKGDQPKYILKVENTDSILLFDNKGKVFKLPVHKVNVTDKSSAGLDIKLLIRNCTADIAGVINESMLLKVLEMKNAKHFLAVVTEGNYVKKMDLEDFENVPTSGLIYTKLTGNDSVKDVIIAPAAFDVIIYSGHKALRTPLSSIPVYKRASQGVIAMNTKDSISGLSLIYPDARYVIVVTEAGRVNKFDIAGLPQSQRNKAGNSVIGLKKTDRIVSIYGVTDNNTIMIIGASGRKTFKVSDIPVSSSVSAGVKLMEASDGTVLKVEIVG